MKKSALILGAAMLPFTAVYAQSNDDAFANDPDMNQSAEEMDQSADDMDTGNEFEGNDEMEASEDSQDFEDEGFEESDSAGMDSDEAYPDTTWGRAKEALSRVAVPADKTDGPGYTYIEGQYIPQGKGKGLKHSGEHNEDGLKSGYGGDISWAGYTSVGAFHPIVQGGWHRYNFKNHDGLALNDSYVGVGGETFIKTPYLYGTGIGFYATVNWERLEARNMNNYSGGRVGTATADGWGVHTGLRWMPLPFLEVNPHAKYRDFGSFAKNGRDLGKPHGFDYGLKLVGYLDEGQHMALTADYTRSDMAIGGDGLAGDGHETKMRQQVKVGARFTF